MWGSQSGVVDDANLLGYGAVFGRVFFEFSKDYSVFIFRARYSSRTA
jgi:hypothetical protein